MEGIDHVTITHGPSKAKFIREHGVWRCLCSSFIEEVTNKLIKELK